MRSRDVEDNILVGWLTPYANRRKWRYHQRRVPRGCDGFFRLFRGKPPTFGRSTLTLFEFRRLSLGHINEALRRSRDISDREIDEITKLKNMMPSC